MSEQSPAEAPSAQLVVVTESGVEQGATPASASAATGAQPARPLVLDPERKLLYAILAVVLVYLMAALTLNAIHLANMYASAEAFMKQEVAERRITANAALHHLDGVMAAHMIGTHKSAALALSFVVVVLGALLVVKGAEASYELRLHGKETKSELITSSPGLVMITLALGLALGVVLHSSEVAIATSGAAPQPLSAPQRPSGPAQRERLNPPLPLLEELPRDSSTPAEQADAGET